MQLFFASLFLAQNTFFKIFDYTQYDQAYSLTECNDGYIIMTNCKYVEGEQSPPVLVKIDKTGNLLWTFNPDPIEYTSDFPITAHRCIIAPDNTILVCGRMGISDSLAAVFVMKVEQDGSLVWCKLYQESYRWYEYYWAEQIVAWPNGDFIVTGVNYRYEPFGGNNPDSMFLFKCNAAGELLHETKINYPPVPYAGYEGGDCGNPIILPNGDIFYCFFARWNTRYHPILVRLDSTLNLQWRKEADGVMGRSYELKMASDGNILMYVEGGYNNYPWGVDPIVQKLTPDGDSLWTYSPPGINSQQGYDMSTLTNGDIVFTGTPDDFEWIRCITFDGQYKWHKKYSPPMGYPDDRHQFTRIMGTSDGGMLVAGWYLRDRFYPMPSIFDFDMFVLKLDSTGCMTPGCNTENYYVDNQEPNLVPQRYMQLHTNILRPFMPIELAFGDGFERGELRLFDASGRLVWQKDVVENIVLEMPTDGLASGAYFLSLSRGGEVLQTERLLVLY